MRGASAACRLALGCVLAFAPAAGQSAMQDLPWPATIEALPTTSGEVYLGNLETRIAVLERALEQTPRRQWRVALASARYERYRIRADLADVEASSALLDAAVLETPGDAQALRLRAGVRAALHRFAEASADLEAAQAAGADVQDVAGARREIALATGRYEELAEALAASGRVEGDFYDLAFRGNLRVLQGDLDGAGEQFRRAQLQADDASPVPLAWLHLQQGIALLRNDRVAEANRFFRAAHERLPGYTAATEHLAETESLLGRTNRARSLYEQAIADTGSPEFVYALSELERASGDRARADELLARAADGWDVLIARHPSAFAQHAIEFLLERGEAERALLLAGQNLDLRRDVGSWILAARAADAAGDRERACEARDSALATGLRPPELEELGALAARCAQPVAGRDTNRGS